MASGSRRRVIVWNGPRATTVREIPDAERVALRPVTGGTSAIIETLTRLISAGSARGTCGRTVAAGWRRSARRSV